MTVPSSIRGRRYVRLTYRLLCLLVLFLPLFSSCSVASLNKKSAQTPSAAKMVMSPLVSSSVLTVGSDTDYLPQEYVDPATHRITGFDIDLVNALVQQAHLKTHVVPENFQQLIDDLLAKRFDVVISALGITPELKKKVDFIPYFVGGESLMVYKGNSSHISSLSDLCGYAVAVKRSAAETQELLSMSDSCRKNGKQAMTIRMTNETTDAIQLLQTRQVVAVYQDASLTDYYIKQHRGLFERGGSIIDPTLEGIAIRKEDKAILQTLQTIFKQLRDDGTYHALIDKWGLYSGDITTSPL